MCKKDENLTGRVDEAIVEGNNEAGTPSENAGKNTTTWSLGVVVTP